jgi:hypothetical protein
VSLLIAYRPFLDPLPLDAVWFLLLVPISFFISMAYKAVRVLDMKDYWRQVMVLTTQIVVSMITLGVGTYVILQHIVPVIAPR